MSYDYDYDPNNPWCARPKPSELSPEMCEVIAALLWSADPRQARPWSMALRWEKEAAHRQVRRVDREVAADLRALAAYVVQGVLADLAEHQPPGVVLPTCPQCATAACRHQGERWLIDIDRLWQPTYKFEYSWSYA